MEIRTYPYDAWVLNQHGLPKKVRLYGPTGLPGKGDTGDMAKKGKVYLLADLYPSKETALAMSQTMKENMSNFNRVSAMNTAFGNPKGDPKNTDWDRVRKQSLNIADEYGETMIALGADPALVKDAVAHLKYVSSMAVNPVNALQVRDGLCDIHVFAYGAHHLMGVDADTDMDAVVDGVMTRFVKDPQDMKATLKLYADKGVHRVYVEGEFPTMVLKSAADQPDAPKGKFLKSASYTDTVFPAV